MEIDKFNKDQTFQIANIVLLLILSLIGELFEILANFNPNNKFPGITGDPFYLYYFLIESIVFASSLAYYFKHSSKYFSFMLVGSMLAIVGMILNILTITSHFLLSLPPISDPAFSGWSIWNDDLVAVVMGLLALPFIMKVKKGSYLKRSFFT